MKARYRIDDWILPYKDDSGKNYIIPNYKLERLLEIEKENDELREALGYALAQEDLTYEMEGESVDKFKLRKVFSVLREALEE